MVSEKLVIGRGTNCKKLQEICKRLEKINTASCQTTKDSARNIDTRKALANMGDIGGEISRGSEMPQELNDLLSFVQTNSPYYQRLWRDVPSDGSASLDQYPVVEHASYWAANTCMNSHVLTGPHVSGIVLKTGGNSSQILKI